MKTLRILQYFILIPACVFMFQTAGAQHNTFMSYTTHFSDHGSVYQPSRLGAHGSNGYISLFYVYPYVGNTAFDLGTLTDNLGSQEGRGQEIYENTLSKLGSEDDQHLLGFGLDFQPLFVSYTIKRDDSELFTLSFENRYRWSANLEFSKNMYKFARRGNSQFKGEEVNLAPMGFNYLQSQEWVLGGNVPVKLSENLTLRSGVRLRYLRGYASVYTEYMDFLVYTDEDSRYIEITPDYMVHTAYPEVEDISREDLEEDFSPLWFMQDNTTPFSNTPVGRGFGIDLGSRIEIGDEYSFSLDLIDLGRINFNNDTRNFSYSGTHTYEGSNVHLNRAVEGEEDWFNDEFIDEFLEYEESFESFSVSLGPKLALGAELGFFSRTSTRTNVDYTMSNIYFTYLQGFDNRLNSTTRPYISTAYSHNFRNVVNLGASLGLGGMNRVMFGTFSSFNLGGFLLGIGSNNMTALISRDAASGADFSLIISGAF